MKTALLLIGIITLILVIGKIYFSFKFKKQVEVLFANTEISNKIYSIQQIIGLPEHAQRYFNYVLKEGQRYINTVRLTHNCFFKTD